MLHYPEKCLRNKTTCEPLAQIEADDKSSFICCGINDGTEREIKQDKYTFCFYSPDIDQWDHMDKTDLLDTASVIMQALSIENH